MKANVINIGTPYIKYVSNNRVKLCANLNIDGIDKEMFFEVDDQYEKYLCVELADAFVCGIFYYASYNRMDITSEAPVSERLLYQLNQYFIPTANKMDSEHYKNIKINAPVSNINFNGIAVGTAVSSGVDSFYSIMSNLNQTYPSYKLTHVIVANLFNRYNSESEVRNRFNELVYHEKNVANTINIPMISMYTNHHDFLFPGYVEFYSLRLCSYAFALQKLFKVYLVSSGTMFQDSNFKSDDSSDYDIFNTSMCSTNNITFYMSGGEAGRVQKIEYIQQFDVVQKYLHVCTIYDDTNCSKCDKCMRTLVALDILGVIEQYEKLFDIEIYIKKKKKFWGKILSMVNDNVYGTLYVELIEEAKKRNYEIFLQSYLIAYLYYKPLYFIKGILKKVKWIKKLYFALKIDYIIHGKEKAELYRFSK